MKSNDLALLRKEARGHLSLYIALSLMFQIVFFRESFFVVQQFLFGLYWSYILPGSTLLFFAKERWGFLERTVAGSALAMAILGTANYYIGIAGLDIQYHTWIFTPILIGLGIGIWYQSRGK